MAHMVGEQRLADCRAGSPGDMGEHTFQPIAVFQRIPFAVDGHQQFFNGHVIDQWLKCHWGNLKES